MTLRLVIHSPLLPVLLYDGGNDACSCNFCFTFIFGPYVLFQIKLEKKQKQI